MRRFLCDINVALDVLLERRPHVDGAAAFWAAVERRKAQAFLPAHGVTTIFHLARRARGAVFARSVVQEMMNVFGVAAVDAAVLRAALTIECPDFEDAVCAAAAVSQRCQAIVTRDPAGFVRAPLPVLAPAAAVALLTAR